MTHTLLPTLADFLSPDDIMSTPEVLAKAAVEGVTPGLVVRPPDTDAVSATLAWANQAGLAVIPRGAGTTLGLGEPPRRADLILALDRLDRMIEYEPADLTVTVQAGMSLGKLQHILGERGQWLPLDPPRGDRRTIGGIIATAASGPHRLGFGTPRDRVIGLRMVQADGLIHRGGAKVVKNVAGYDLPKLLVGSLGTLGVVTEATLKLLPLPRVWGTSVIRCPNLSQAATLAGQVLTSALSPAALCILDAGGIQHLLSEAPGVVSLDSEAVLVTRFGGIPQAVTRQLNELKSMAERVVDARSLQANGHLQLVNDDAMVWGVLADLPVAITANRAVRFKTAVIPTRLADALQVGQTVAQAQRAPVAQIAYAGQGVVYTTMRGFGDTDELQTRLSQAALAMRAAIAELGGTTVIEHAPLPIKAAAGVWGPTRPDFRMMQALKTQFDPRGTLNPGRFVGGI